MKGNGLVRLPPVEWMRMRIIYKRTLADVKAYKRGKKLVACGMPTTDGESLVSFPGM